LKENHIQWRFECSQIFKDNPPEFWENFLITDEKIWTTNGMFNAQKYRVRAEKAEDVPPLDMDKFPAQRMLWMGISAKGTTGLHWLKGKVNGQKYLNKILENAVLKDVLQRKGFNKPIHKRKLFKSNARMIFEQDFATPHSTNANQAWMEEHFPNHTPTLHRFRGVSPLFFPPKMDDFWPIERVWAIIANKVYREPRPKTIAQVMRRVREESNKLTEKTLTRLVHALPAKMNEIHRLKGKKIPPTFDPHKSPFACRCSICTE